ncbi:MAG: PadR family transcriptional regulator [Caldilineaceae bacterium]
MANIFRRSNIALAVLAFLAEAPMHPYRMQQLIKERGKDEIINVRQRASLYQTIQQLLRAKLIQVRETEREPKRPERTIYELTVDGRATLDDWLRQMLSTPASEFPEFPAALAYLPLLSVEDATLQLQTRTQVLAAEHKRIDGQLREAAQSIPRLFLIETEYMLSMLATELAWVNSLIHDLQTGKLTWSDAWKAESVAQQTYGEEK